MEYLPSNKPTVQRTNPHDAHNANLISAMERIHTIPMWIWNSENIISCDRIPATHRPYVRSKAEAIRELQAQFK